VTTAAEKWADRPPSTVLVWLLAVVAALGLAAAVLTTNWWKGLAVGLFLLCSNLALIAWRARRRTQRS
jgi:membrane protein implicated in regulation of membrane protease activity